MRPSTTTNSYHMFRRTRLIRYIAVFLLVNTFYFTFLPTISWALTTGPHQPEYTSYEEPGSTDMVNLLTGDFTYSLPLVEVPGPEGGFPVELSYHSGIGLEQEASWTGLGWNFNPGSITRNVTEYPDDANGETFQIHRSDQDLARGWVTRIPGIGQFGWDSNAGKYGSFSILGLVGASYNSNGVDAGVLGVQFGSSGVTVNPQETIRGVTTLATLGTSNIAQASVEVAKQFAWEAAVDAAFTASFGVGSPNFNVGGYWQVTKKTKKKWFKTKYWVWLDQTRYEDMYGTLFMGNMPTALTDSDFEPNISGSTTRVFVEPLASNDKGAASDMYYSWDGTNYIDSFEPSHLALDNYNVNGLGVSGNMAPYRLDVGSLAFPRMMNEDHTKIAMARFNDNNFLGNSSLYKVQFKFDDLASNSYYHHVGGTGTSGSYTFNLNSTQYGIDHSLISNELYYSLSDPTLAVTTNLMENRSTGEGLNNNRLSLGKHVEWFTNSEIINNKPGFLDFQDDAASSSFRSSLSREFLAQSTCPGGQCADIGDKKIFLLPTDAGKFSPGQSVEVTYWSDCGTGITFSTNVSTNGVNSDHIIIDDFNGLSSSCNISYVAVKGTADNLSSSAIGGFNVTREDGQTFHYALPVYNWGNFTYIEDLADPDKITRITQNDPFAKTWLITAITGPDYIDRNSNGMVDSGDWGKWIKFNYAKTDDYKWRMPYTGEIVTSDNLSKTFSEGYRQSYFLNSIQTRTHTALFAKGTRLDARSAGKHPLRLDEVILLRNGDYQALITPTGQGGQGIDADQAIMTTDLAAKAAFLDPVTIRKIRLGYNYELCQNTPNSLEANKGKLTLKTVNLGGRNGSILFPDYKFSYASNPDYHKDKWDGWGMYYSAGTSAVNSHQAPFGNQDGVAWSLTNIRTPLGSEIEIQYERDEYHSVADRGRGFVIGGNLRVQNLIVKDQNGVEYKTGYGYDVTDSGGSGSGVVSEEPDYIRELNTATDTYEFYDHFDWPQTPVLYGRVAVYNGRSGTASDHSSKQVFHFETPHSDMVSESSNLINSSENELFRNDDGPIYIDYNHYITKYKHTVDINTSKIGRVKKVELYDSDGLVSTTDFGYNTSELDDNQGVFTEGTLLFERLFEVDGFDFNTYHRAMRTTKRKYPSFLITTTTTTENDSGPADDIISSVENKEFDFITGAVTESKGVSGMGYKTRTVTIPAFRQYAGMKDKGTSIYNPHMLSQTAANYTFLLDNAGAQIGMLSASAQTWKHVWNTYRVFNGSQYVDQSEGQNVWRKHEQYAYRGTISDQRADGTITFTGSDYYDFVNSSNNTEWLKASEITRYDHYSMPLETKDLNDDYASVKLGIDQSVQLAETANARYTEMAYTGAEDDFDGNGFLPGEIRRLDGARSTTKAHTGLYSISTAGIQSTMQFKSQDLTPGRVYRLSVWSTEGAGKIRYKIDGGSTQTVTVSSPKNAGEWYQLNANITGGTSIEAWVEGISGTTVYWDDFRFHPIDAPFSSHVYDPLTNDLTYSLDNNNLYTHFQYDASGRLTATYRESFNYGGTDGKLLVSTTEYYDKAIEDLDATDFTVSLSGGDQPALSRQWTAAVNGGLPPYEYNWYDDGALVLSENTFSTTSNYSSSECANYDLTVEVFDKSRKKVTNTTSTKLPFSYTVSQQNAGTNAVTWTVHPTNENGPVDFKWAYKNGLLNEVELTGESITIDTDCNYTLVAKPFDGCIEPNQTQITPVQPDFDVLSLSPTGSIAPNEAWAKFNRLSGTAILHYPTGDEAYTVNIVPEQFINPGGGTEFFGVARATFSLPISCIDNLEVYGTSSCNESTFDEIFIYEPWGYDLDQSNSTTVSGFSLINEVEGSKPRSEVQYQWYDPNGAVAGADGLNQGFDRDLCDDYQISVKITDSCNKPVTYTATVPEIVFSYSTSTPFQQNGIGIDESVGFAVSVTNACPTGFTYTWETGLDPAVSVCGSGGSGVSWTTICGNSPNCSYNWDEEGAYVVRVTMSEGGGETQCQSFGVNVGPYNP